MRLPFDIEPPRKRQAVAEPSHTIDRCKVSPKDLLMPQKPKPKPQQKPNAVKLASLLDGGRFGVSSAKPSGQALRVTLKASPDKLRKVLTGKLKPLRELQKTETPRAPRAPKDPAKSATALFFKEVRARSEAAAASQSIAAKEHTAKINRKHMDLPHLARTDFVHEDSADRAWLQATAGTVQPLDLESRDAHCSRALAVTHAIAAADHMALYNACRHIEKPQTPPAYTGVPEDQFDRIYSFKDTRFERFADPQPELRLDRSSQWVDLFRPRDHSQLMQLALLRNGVRRWIVDAFNRLKRVDRHKRQKLLKKKRKNAKAVDNEMDGFIVNDFEDEGSETEDENASFVPSLIITGPVGCGKTAAVYSIVAEELQGYVFELNSGQPRAKKDISFHLKQIGTTQIVNKSEEADRKKTVILFEDVDLIDDEDSDKEFWDGATELLSYSYRPVIFTARDLTSIPRHIVDKSAVFCFDSIAAKPLAEYLDLVALQRGLDLDSDILQELTKRDLRGALMQLQMFSYQFHIPDEGLVKIKKVKKQGTAPPAATQKNLKQLDQDYEMRYLMGQHDYDDDDDDADDLPDHYTVQRDNAVEFLSSQYFANGTRKRELWYDDGKEYLATHPGNMFERLASKTLTTEVLPIIRSIARKEEERRQLNDPEKRFEVDPLELWDPESLSAYSI